MAATCAAAADKRAFGLPEKAPSDPGRGLFHARPRPPSGRIARGAAAARRFAADRFGDRRLAALFAKRDDGDFPRAVAVAEAVLQAIMEADVESLIGADRHERADTRCSRACGA